MKNNFFFNINIDFKLSFDHNLKLIIVVEIAYNVIFSLILSFFMKIIFIISFFIIRIFLRKNAKMA